MGGPGRINVLRRPPAKDVVLAASETEEEWVARLDTATGVHIRLTLAGVAIGESVTCGQRDMIARAVRTFESYQHAIIGLNIGQAIGPVYDDLMPLIHAFPSDLRELNMARMLDASGVCLLLSQLPHKLVSLDISGCFCQCRNHQHEIRRDLGPVEGCPDCQSVDAVVRALQTHPCLQVLVAHQILHIGH